MQHGGSSRRDLLLVSFASAAWAVSFSGLIIGTILSNRLSGGAVTVVIVGGWVAWGGLTLWLRNRSALSVPKLIGLAALVLTPAIWLAWYELANSFSYWPGLHQSLLDAFTSTRVLIRMTLDAIIVFTVSAIVVAVSMRQSSRDSTLLVAGWAAVPAAGTTLVAICFFTWGPRWLVVGLSILVIVVFGFSTKALSRRWALRPLTIAGLVIALVIPLLAIGGHEILYNWDDKYCSSGNIYLRVHPLLRVIAHASSIFLVVRGGAAALGRGRWLLTALLIFGAVVVQVPAGYYAFRTCNDELGQALTEFWIDEKHDLGCEEGGCSCGLAYDWIGRPRLLRAGKSAVQLWAPAWLLVGEPGQRASEEFLLSHDLQQLPPQRCPQ
jgi:hypothetical protein